MKQIQPFKLPSLIKFILLEQFPKVYFIFVLQYHHGFPLTSLLILSYFFNALLGYIALSFFGLNLENLLFFFFLNTNYINFCFQGEIGRRSGGDNVLEREGHAVSAGFALGLVALGMNA